MIVGTKPPAGVQCLHCRRVAKEGDIILCHTVHNQGYLLFHKECIIEVLDSAPLGTYEEIVARVAEGEPLFT